MNTTPNTDVTPATFSSRNEIIDALTGYVYSYTERQREIIISLIRTDRKNNTLGSAVIKAAYLAEIICHLSRVDETKGMHASAALEAGWCYHLGTRIPSDYQNSIKYSNLAGTYEKDLSESQRDDLAKLKAELAKPSSFRLGEESVLAPAALQTFTTLVQSAARETGASGVKAP